MPLRWLASSAIGNVAPLVPAEFGAVGLTRGHGPAPQEPGPRTCAAPAREPGSVSAAARGRAESACAQALLARSTSPPLPVRRPVTHPGAVQWPSLPPGS